MPKATPIYTRFTAGEFSSRMKGAVDLPGYYQACILLENMLVTPQGGAERRPGTYFVANGKTNANKIRLIPFELASGNYVLELGDAYVRFYKDGAQLLDGGGSPVEGAWQGGVTPWALADLFEIKYVQTNDTLYLVHPTYDVIQITRTSDTVWVVAGVAFVGDGAPGFNAANDRPSAIAFYEQKMVLAGSNNNPNRVWLSKPGSILDFSAADGQIYDVYHDKYLSIKWLEAKKQIVFGSGNCEGTIHGSGAPLTSSTVQFGVDSTYGVADVQGELVNENVLFLQKGARKLREFSYNNDRQGNMAPDLTLLADHVGDDVLTQMAIQGNPYTILWAVRNDGELMCLTYELQYQIAAWARMKSDGASGEVESVAVITGATEDQIWVSVKRTVDSTTKRFVEYFKARNFGSDQADCYFVDSGVTLDGGAAATITGATQADPVVITSANHGFDNNEMVKIVDVAGMTEINTNVYTVKNKTAHTFALYLTDGTSSCDGTDFTAYTSGGTAQKVYNTITGLDHLEGESVDILADGAVQPRVTVASGEVDMANSLYANVVHAGLPFTSYLQPMAIEAGAAVGTAQGKKKRIDQLIIRFYKTLGCKVGPDADTLDIIAFRMGDDPMDAPPPLYTGDKEVPWPGGWDAEAPILIVQDQPLPLTVTALMPRLSTSD